MEREKKKPLNFYLRLMIEYSAFYIQLDPINVTDKEEHL